MLARHVVIGLAVGLGLGLAPQNAMAISPAVFDLTLAPDNVPSFDLVVDGITMTASNFVSENNLSIADFEGLCFAGKPNLYCEDTSSLSLTFSSTVKLVSYETGYNSFSNKIDDAVVQFQQGPNSTIQKDFQVNVTNSFVNQFIAVANSPVLVSRLSTVSGGSLQLSKLTVEKQVASVPGPLSFAGLAVAFGYSRRIRLRNSRP